MRPGELISKRFCQFVIWERSYLKVLKKTMLMAKTSMLDSKLKFVKEYKLKSVAMGRVKGYR